MNRSWILWLAGLALLAATDYQSEIAAWRRAREANLKAEGGWLSLAGLFWLNEGANSFGTDPANRIALGDGPARAGVFELHDGKVTVLQDGRTRELKPDSADAVTAGRLSLFVIQRGGKYGIRLKDPESQARRKFHGLSYWAAREEYRVTARFTPAPREIPITNVLGQTEPMKCPGYVTFRLVGRQLRLYPVLEEPQAKELFFIFRDRTSGKETYGAARFLDSELPREGQVVLDFNRAYNPPCAFTPYATCPLPPLENRLPVRIEAGEKKYGH
jgi:uncharacterized protein (DUF1684 family)